jgi:hypothetical protein
LKKRQGSLRTTKREPSSPPTKDSMMKAVFTVIKVIAVAYALYEKATSNKRS